MIDCVSYRVRVGLYNNKRCRNMKKKNKDGINGLNTHYWKYIMILTDALGSKMIVLSIFNRVLQL